MNNEIDRQKDITKQAKNRDRLFGCRKRKESLLNF